MRVHVLATERGRALAQEGLNSGASRVALKALVRFFGLVCTQSVEGQ